MTLDEQLKKVIADGEALAGLADRAAPIAKDLALGSRCNIIMELARRGRDRSFQIIFAGEFNSGKSTAINALLGEPVMPMKVVEANAILTRIRYASTKRAVLHPATGGTPIEVPYDDFARHIVVDRSDRKKPSKWKYADLYYPLEILRQGIIIVDPPGTNALPGRQQRAAEEAANSDAAVFLFFAGQPFKESERAFIVGCLDGKETFWLVTHADYLDAEDVSVVREDLEQQLRESRPYDDTIPARIFFVNAQRAQKSAARKDDGGLAASGMKDFFLALGNFISGDRHRAKMQDLCAQLTDSITVLDQATESQRLDTERAHQDVIKRYQKLKAELDAAGEDADNAVELLASRIFPLADKVSRRVRSRIRSLPGNLPFDSSDMVLSEMPTIRMWMGFDKEKKERIIDAVRVQVVRMIQEDIRNWFNKEVGQDIKADLDTELEKFDHVRNLFEEKLGTIRDEYLELPPSRRGHRPAVPELEAKRFTDVISRAIRSVTGALQIPTPSMLRSFQIWADTPYDKMGGGTWENSSTKAAQEFAFRIGRMVVEQIAEMSDDLADNAHEEMHAWFSRVQAAAIKSISDPRIDLEKTAAEGERTSRLRADEKQKRRTQLAAYRAELSALGREVAILRARYATH